MKIFIRSRHGTLRTIPRELLSTNLAFPPAVVPDFVMRVEIYIQDDSMSGVRFT